MFVMSPFEEANSWKSPTIHGRETLSANLILAAKGKDFVASASGRMFSVIFSNKVPKLMVELSQIIVTILNDIERHILSSFSVHVYP